ncbi:MAG TPA: response regulator [Pirellulaceae bacterium]|nr:response regulator [Pirellulaceae bacterium]HMO92142.1 response regulator [Pirellulaceae bacterium]HMP68933.1 response regulator [Pirellulaceae bacterium]
MLKPSKVIVLADAASDSSRLRIPNGDSDTELAHSFQTAFRLVQQRAAEGMYIPAERLSDPRRYWDLVFQLDVINQSPDGIAVVDASNQILGVNRTLHEWVGETKLVGSNFYDALGDAEALGPNFSPLTTAIKTKKLCKSTLKTASGMYFQLRAAPIIETELAQPQYVIVTLRDVSTEMLHLEKLESIHRAGAELADLTPEEVFQMDVPDRIELLKANIIHYTQDLLNYDVVEIRLIDQKTLRLEPLISMGIDSEESKHPLYARATGNGVSGFVCATGKSYLCEDTSDDPLYVKGLVGAKSSLTVPLIYHEQVIGSFNVESPFVNAFSESDLQLLQIFARDVAIALNTLELLVAQRTNAAQQSVGAIRAAVAAPIDDILNDTVHVIENYIGHDPGVSKRLRTILKNARLVRQAIQKVEQDLAPDDMIPHSVLSSQRPALNNKRILVVDADDDVRNSAHDLLERFGCIVETAHEGREAILMIRNSDPDHSYSAIIADIRLPDIGGFEFFLKLKELLAEPPLILMSGYGYDPGHAIVKSRKAGLRSNAVLFKPFKLQLLLEVVEQMINPPD